jgi:predicted transcriptional regulator
MTPRERKHMTDNMSERSQLLTLTTDIVAAYVGSNAVANEALSGVISDVFAKLSDLGQPAAEPEVPPTPAVSIKKSITDDYVVCLDCGKKQKMLKRHLTTAHAMTPDDYRAKWSLGYDYPMVAPNYSEQRKKLAVKIGLGRKSAKPAPKRRRKS